MALAQRGPMNVASPECIQAVVASVVVAGSLHIL